MRVRIDKHMLAYCGLYCAQCSFKTAHDEGDEKHLEAIPYPFARRDLSEYNCECCKGRCICGPCAIRPCASEKGLDCCADCATFPCETIRAFENDGMPHHAQAFGNLKSIREKGLHAWFEALEPTLRCACGEKQTWYHTCPKHS